MFRLDEQGTNDPYIVRMQVWYHISFDLQHREGEGGWKDQWKKNPEERRVQRQKDVYTSSINTSITNQDLEERW